MLPPIERARPKDLRRGYLRECDAVHCLFCDVSIERGLVYPSGEGLRTARKAIEHHVLATHGGPLGGLLSLGKVGHGLSDVQAEVVALWAGGQSDRDVAEALGRSPSTVRNHRFQLRRKHREARLFVALMDLLEDPMNQQGALVQFHSTLPVSDDRTWVTTEEAEQLLGAYFEDRSRTVLKRIPKKEKHKLVVLRCLVERFEPERRYAEREVSELLKEAHADYAALRRYLVDYRFLERLSDGSAYWRVDVD